MKNSYFSMNLIIAQVVYLRWKKSVDHWLGGGAYPFQENNSPS
jgi:hypothetical protein